MWVNWLSNEHLPASHVYAICGAEESNDVHEKWTELLEPQLTEVIVGRIGPPHPTHNPSSFTASPEAYQDTASQLNW